MYLRGKIKCIAAYLLKARIVKPAEKAVAREWLCEQQPLVAIMWSPQQTSMQPQLFNHAMACHE
jgi:hypothetical protein